MTTPNFDWARPKPIADNSQTPSFDWAKSQSEPQLARAGTPSPGFLDYVGNLAVNWYKTSGVQNMMDMEKMGMPVQYNNDDKAIRDQIIKGRQAGSGMDIALGDFQNFFGKILENGKDQVNKILQAPGQALDSFTHDPVSFLGQMGKAFVTPIGDYAELSSRVTLTGDDIRALTPEEKAARIKSTVALGAMMATGVGAAKLLGATEVAAGSMTTEQLLNASRLTAKGALAKEVMRSTAVAATGGAAYGLTAHANEGDQLSEALINGVMFAPLGVAFEVLGIGKGVKRQLNNAQKAGEIARLRQVQDVMDNSFHGITQQIESLTSSNDLAEAVLDGRLKTGTNDLIHIPGVSSDQIGRLATHVPEGFKTAYHFDPSGETGSVLVYSNAYDHLIDPKFFAENGFAENQVVSYGGRKQYVVTGGDGKTLHLTNLSDPGERLSVPKDVVRTLTGMELDRSSIKMDPIDSKRIESLERIANGVNVARPLREEAKAQMEQIHNKYSAGKEAGLLYISPLNRDIVVDRMYQEWKGQLNKKPPTELETLRSERQQLVDKGAPQAQLDTYDNRISNLERVESSPQPKIGDDPAADIINRIPTQDVAQHLNDFLDGKQFATAEKPSLKRDFEKRLALEAFASDLDDADRALVTSAHDAIAEHITQEARAMTNAREMDSAKLIRLANTNGMTISDGGAGRVLVRDIESGRLLEGFNSPGEATTFINKTAQANGIDLDQGGSISSVGASGGRSLPPSGPPPLPSDFPWRFFNAPRRLLRALWSEHFIRGLDNVALVTRNREFMLNVDEKYGSSIHARVMEPTQKNANVRNSAMTPYIQEIAEQTKSMEKMSSLQREQVGQWMQTMNPVDVQAKFMTRPMNALEVALGQQVAESGVDLERVFKYRREIEKLNKEFADADTPEKKAEHQKQLQGAKDAYGIDDKHEQVNSVFDNVLSMGKREASLGAIVRLARSITDKEMGRSDFAAHHKMTMDQIRAGNTLEAQYKKLGDRFGIPPEFRLGGYMTHARLYTDGNISQAMRHFAGDVKAREFYAKMARTGEISAYETDPLRAIQRYVKAGFDAQGFNESIANAKNALEEELQKLPSGAQRHVRNVTERYLDDLRGFPEAGDLFAQEAVDYYMNRYKMGMDVNVRKQWVNGITALIPAATQGARLMSGITHWATATMVSIADRGLAYTKRMHEQGAYARMNPDVLEEIRANGGLSTVSPIAAYTQAEYAQTAFAKGLTKGTLKSAEVLFKLSGLQDVYTMLSAGHYLATKADAINALTRFGRDEIQWKQVKKELFLDKHYEPVKRQFESLVKSGKTEEAAQFLATQTVNDMVGVFGNANHPYLWGSNVGRVMGEFGNWPSWLRGTVTRMASRGTTGQRIASIAKLSAMSWLGVKAGEDLGIDLSRLNMMESLGWWGGPLEDVAEDVAAAFKGSGYSSQQATRRLRKYLPFDIVNGQMHVQGKQIYLPGSFAIDSFMNAVNDFQHGNTVQGLGEAAGFRTTGNRFTVRGGGI